MKKEKNNTEKIQFLSSLFPKELLSYDPNEKMVKIHHSSISISTLYFHRKKKVYVLDDESMKYQQVFFPFFNKEIYISNPIEFCHNEGKDIFSPFFSMVYYPKAWRIYLFPFSRIIASREIFPPIYLYCSEMSLFYNYRTREILKDDNWLFCFRWPKPINL